MPHAKKVRTPGSYGDSKKEKRVTPKKITPKKKGRPGFKIKRKREFAKRRENYTEEDMKEAVCLVREEDFTVKRASEEINDVKQN